MSRAPLIVSCGSREPAVSGLKLPFLCLPQYTLIILALNKKDTLLRIPYGQALFEGIVAETISPGDFIKLKDRFNNQAVSFFEEPMRQNNLDAVLSINN